MNPRTNKYIMIENHYGHEQPILFPDYIKHQEIAIALKGMGRLLSAGDCSIAVSQGKVSVWVGGRSSTLDLGPRTADQEIIRQFFVKSGL